jgi:hypothetical protein
VAVRVLGAGVLIRLATDDEVEAVEYARRGREFELRPSRSHFYVQPDRPLDEGELYVVSQAFVEFADGTDERWVSFEHHGHRVSVVDDATLDLLKLAQDTAVEDFADLRIAGLAVSRW